MALDPLSTVSLQVIIEDKVLFQSSGKWLYPLFDLKAFLETEEISLDNAQIYDKIIGKAAAFLLLVMGARHVHGGVMSELATPVFKDAGIDFSHDQLVAQIACKTEALLLEVDDPGEAYQILCRRAKRC